MRFPFSARVLAARLRDVEEALVSWDEQSRQQALEQEQVIQHLGERLFDGLFTGSVRRPYDATLNQAARQHKGLRLKLCIEPPELALVPWELLYDQRPEKYVCHTSAISLVSYQNPPQTASVTSLPPPVRVLAVLVRPVDATAEDLQRDRACLTEAAQGLQVRDLSELEWLEKPTWRKLLRAISTTEWHVLYLGGDSRPDRDSGETALTLAGDEIQSQLLGASRLTRVLASKPEPPFAWLTPLHDAPAGRRQPLSRIATTLVDRGPPAALVLDYQVSKSAQITFARALLGRLLDALPVDLALARGRSAVFDAGLGPVAWAIPALYTHTPSWQLVRPVRTGVSSRGEVALAHATLLEAMDDGALAPQMALHPLEGERQELMDEVREALGDAEPTLSTLSGSAENQADAVIQVIEQVKKVQERLPTSQAIQVMLLRAGQAAQSLRD